MEGGPPRFSRDFSDPNLLGYRRHASCRASPTGLSPATAGRSRPLRLTRQLTRDKPHVGPTTPEAHVLRFGLFRVRSPLLAESRLISLPPGTEMFQFPRLASLAGSWTMTSTGFPHSEIPGSTPACGSPRLIAACHVLHRLPAPRHPPCALTALSQHFFPLASPGLQYNNLSTTPNALDFLKLPLKPKLSKNRAKPRELRPQTPSKGLASIFWRSVAPSITR